MIMDTNSFINSNEKMLYQQQLNDYPHQHHHHHQHHHQHVHHDLHLDLNITPSSLIIDSSSILPSVAFNITQDWHDLVSVNLLELSFYVFLFTIGGSANFYVVYNLAWRKRYTQTRHEKLLLNLAIADAIVTLLMTPTEIAWRITASWKAGNLMCKLFQFYRVFGIYLSSMVLICISIDRLLAVYSPFKYQTYDNFIRKILICAWLLSFIFALPQIFIFRIESPKDFPTFTQCVNFKAATEDQLRMYNIFCLCIIYFVPLLCITLCYTFICIKIRRKMVQRFLTVFRNGDLGTAVNPESQHSDAYGLTNHQQHLHPQQQQQPHLNDVHNYDQVDNPHENINIDPTNHDDYQVNHLNLGDTLTTNHNNNINNNRCDYIDNQSIAISTMITTIPGTNKVSTKGTGKSTGSLKFSILSNPTGGTTIQPSVPMTVTKTAATIKSTTSRQRRKIGSKIVKDTIIIIATFIICWTPYATIHLWYQIDWSSAFQVDNRLQGVLFLFAISNSCVNPYIYGKIFDPACLIKQ